MTRLLTCFLVLFTSTALAQPDHPHLRKVGDATQLIVDGAPYLVLGGELGNSTFTSPEAMAPVWPKLKAMHLNTVLAPVYWELIEPVEGQFDFTLLDALIGEAREHDLRLVLLWFGAWKNSMSSHAPAWVKTDQERFPRARDADGRSQEILSPFSANNLAADRAAYVALMKHIRAIDGERHTVIMVQPENEIGMLPSARDHHPLAEAAWQAPVPAELMDVMAAKKGRLAPEFEERWAAQGYPESGTWAQVFGADAWGQEIFMAWHYARFTETVTAAGKAEYPLPMFVNAALNRPGRLPGEYPSAGPLPHLMDVWQAGAPSVDFLSPDFYNPDIEHWSDLYVRQGNPLFIPEHRFDDTVAAKAAFVLGRYEAIGFSPFSIESTDAPGDEALGKLYRLLEPMTPLIAAHQGQGRMDGVLLEQDAEPRQVRLGDYAFAVSHFNALGYSGDGPWPPAGALIVQTGEREFYLAGSGVVLNFSKPSEPRTIVGILKTDQGEFRDGQWTVIRHLNGDQTHQGRHVRIPSDEWWILRFELYEYD